MAELNWTEAQWQRVNEAVLEAFDKASVASAFLPRFVTPHEGVVIVRNERLLLAPPRETTIRLDSDHEGVNLRLVDLAVNVELTSEQVSDDSLSNALLAFRRAANILALEQDRIVFDGYRRGDKKDDSAFVVNQVNPQMGLADLPARYLFPTIQCNNIPAEIGQNVVSHVVGAIGKLEESSNPGPYACVLGDDLFNSVHTPSSALVLPADRIIPQLKGGQLLRSGKMKPKTGVIVSLAGGAIDIVVGKEKHVAVNFLQRQPNARYLFRASERFVLRIRDETNIPIAGFRFDPGNKERDEERSALVRKSREAAVLSNALEAVSYLRLDT